jgi:hypothetical protein
MRPGQVIPRLNIGKLYKNAVPPLTIEFDNADVFFG